MISLKSEPLGVACIPSTEGTFVPVVYKDVHILYQICVDKRKKSEFAWTSSCPVCTTLPVLQTGQPGKYCDMLQSCRRRLFLAPQLNAVGRRYLNHLSYETFQSKQAIETPTKSLVTLHGILGSKKNWRTPCNIWVKKFPQYCAIAMDHRGHGISPKNMPGDNTVVSCAADVLLTLQQTECIAQFKDGDSPSMIWGHSFSGKVVLSFLEQQVKSGRTLPEHVWILDSLPGLYDLEHDSRQRQSVLGIIDTIFYLPTVFESKPWIEQLLASKGISKPIIDWLSTNIIANDPSEPKPTSFRYSFDIQTVTNLMHAFCNLDMWGMLENYNSSTKIHFIRAGKNSMWTPEIVARFDALQQKNPNIAVHTMPHVGHWLHAEDALGMVDLIARESGLK
jgi:pimeloyl-ACP methyl ester carboxylesterase